MTLINTETGEIVSMLNGDQARRLTERIRIAAANYVEAKAKVLTLVDEAKAGQAHVALGYKSWTAYLSDVLSDEPLRLARDDRRELTVRLADEGMSSAAIAPIVGVTDRQVRHDIDRADNSEKTSELPVTRTTTGLDGRERTTVTTGRRQAVARDDAETYLNLVEASAAKAAREAKNLTSDQIRRVRPKADLWTVGLRNSVEVLQHLIDSLKPEENK